MLAGLADGQEVGHVIVVAQQDVQLDTTFGPAELCPFKKGQTQRDGGRVQQVDLELEAKLLVRLAQQALVAESLEAFPKEVFEELVGAVLVGIAERRFVRSLADAQVNHLTHAAGQTVTDDSQGIGSRDLGEEHGHEMGPAIESFGVALRSVLADQQCKLGSGDVTQQLTKKARGLYHGWRSPWGKWVGVPRKPIID